MNINDNEVIQMSSIKSREEYPLILKPTDVQEILGIGRRGTYELLNNPPFHVNRIGKNGRFIIARDVLFNWVEGKG